MASRLLNIVRFAGLVVGVPVVQAHNLNNDGRLLVPDFVVPTLGGFTVAVDNTDVTVTRTVDAPAGAVDVFVENWYTVLRIFGTTPPPGTTPDGSLAPQPLIIQPGTTAGVGVAGREALPEKWAQNNVAAGQVNVDLVQRVSTLFATTKMIRAGSVIGLSTRLTEAITAGILTVTVEINGAATTLLLAHNVGVNPLGGEVVVAAGADPFVAGDFVGIVITTTAAFLPITTDLECWIDIDTD
ncbi:hypothetical protein LCGC14_1343150 [marine sediment metagenome]|uniref:Uncharacterized protein n=1 Tax=marine sediment metagenome TaxID=412755 RepID=A0A0F9NFG6_9ZZZZ